MASFTVIVSLRRNIVDSIYIGLKNMKNCLEGWKRRVFIRKSMFYIISKVFLSKLHIL
jgi:hypothetical protein